MTTSDPEAAYPATSRTRPTRNNDRVSYDRTAVHAVLDEALICHVGFVADGKPVVLPHLYARVGDMLYLHGSTAARAFEHPHARGMDVCVTVTLVDGLVFARSAFHHSVNYRSVVAHGLAVPVVEEERKRAALAALVNAAARGRAEQTRPPSAKELAATAVLALKLLEVSVKTRNGPPNDDPADLALDYWAGVLPLRLIADEPVPAPGVIQPIPDGVNQWARPARRDL